MACPVNEESPFWKAFDANLTGKARTTNEIKLEGLYSLEVSPGSDAGVVIQQPKDSIYSIEFMILNKHGELGFEVLQYNSQTDTVAVNSRIGLYGDDLGVLQNGITTVNFTYQPDTWNKIAVLIRINTGEAFLSVNDSYVAQWPWRIQLDGTSNSNSLGGIRFVNSASGAGLSSYIDNLKIVNQNIVSSEPALLQEMAVNFIPLTGELVIIGAKPGTIREISIFDLNGRKINVFRGGNLQAVRMDQNIPDGFYFVVVNRFNDRPFTRKIAVIR
jgi:hypothetical protein